MNSPIKLPELPVSPQSVYFEGDGNEPGELVPMYSGIQMRIYAERAVRDALAAQVPVAWMLDARKGMSDPLLCWGNPEGIYSSTYVPLALIPENSQTAECGACNGTGRMVRDPDIGTDQECFACDGSGRHE